MIVCRAKLPIACDNSCQSAKKNKQLITFFWGILAIIYKNSKKLGFSVIFADITWIETT